MKLTLVIVFILLFPQSAFAYDFIIRGRTDIPYIALTFDDGPKSNSTPKILAILKKNKIPATFFVVGKQAQKYPNLISAEAACGMEIGNHTYSHPILNNLSAKAIENEIRLNENIIKKLAGYKTKYFRPPAGHFNDNVTQIIKKLGYKTILCTNNAGDYYNSTTGWQPDKKYIKSKVLGNIRGGAIILMHDGPDMTISLLDEIIIDLKKRGYKFVTVSDLIKYKSFSGKLPNKPL